jgi:flagellar biosynthesis/type III secretory pathway protein FliH
MSGLDVVTTYDEAYKQGFEDGQFSGRADMISEIKNECSKMLENKDDGESFVLDLYNFLTNLR